MIELLTLYLVIAFTVAHALLAFTSDHTRYWPWQQGFWIRHWNHLKTGLKWPVLLVQLP